MIGTVTNHLSLSLSTLLYSQPTKKNTLTDPVVKEDGEDVVAAVEGEGEEGEGEVAPAPVPAASASGNHPKWDKLKLNVAASKVNLIRSVRSFKVRC